MAIIKESAGAANPFDGINPGGDNGPALADLDDDGDPDLFVWNRSGNIDYFENTGTASAPVFTERTDAANPLEGRAGNDTIHGLAGDDTLNGNDGDGHLDSGKNPAGNRQDRKRLFTR